MCRRRGGLFDVDRRAPARVANGDVQALRLDKLAEAAHASAIWGFVGSVLDGIERNEVHMGQLAAKKRAQLFRITFGVVDAAKQYPFVADTPARLVRVTLRGGDEVRDWIFAIDRYKHIAQLVACSVQGDGERDGELLLAQLLDARDEPARGDDDPARADAEKLRIRETPHRLDHRLVVGHRLAHAHEDHVGEALAFG